MSGPFRFNALLTHAGIDPKEVRLLRNHAVPADAADLFELWKRDVALFEAFQSYQKVSARAYFASPWWASFVTTRDGGTAFVGLYHAANPQPVTEPMVAPITGMQVEPGSYEQYQVIRDDSLADYAGRLFIDWGLDGSTPRNWRQRAWTQDKAIVELRRSVAAPAFPGALRFSATVAGLSALPSGWIDQLTTARGVYLLTCPTSGACYVGAASGADGFWGRWQSYAASGHGGNVALIERLPADYRISILQLAGSADTADDILAMEALWKHKLAAREAGLNRN